MKIKSFKNFTVALFILSIVSFAVGLSVILLSHDTDGLFFIAVGICMLMNAYSNTAIISIIKNG